MQNLCDKKFLPAFFQDLFNFAFFCPKKGQFLPKNAFFSKNFDRDYRWKSQFFEEGIKKWPFLSF